MPLIRGFEVTPADFRAHLDLIVARGLTALTVSEYAAACDRGDAPLLQRSVVITFDDGWADFGSVALPLLRERGLRSTLYVTSGFLPGGADPPIDADLARHMLDWSSLAGLRAGGTEIGAHSHTHPHLDTVSRRRALDEVERSRGLLEDATGAAVETFAYPHGYSSPRLRRMVAEGYRSACGVKDAFSSPADQRYSLARLMLRSHTSLGDVEGWLDRRGAPPPPARETARTRGWRAYRRTRALLARRPWTDAGWPVAR